jgi:hypothetical protein
MASFEMCVAGEGDLLHYLKVFLKKKFCIKLPMRFGNPVAYGIISRCSSVFIFSHCFVAVSRAAHILLLIKRLIFIFKVLYNLEVNFTKC